MQVIYSDVLLQLSIVVIDVSFLPFQYNAVCFSLCIVFIFELNRDYKQLLLLSPLTKLVSA